MLSMKSKCEAKMMEEHSKQKKALPREVERELGRDMPSIAEHEKQV